MRALLPSLYERHERAIYRFFLRQGAATSVADDLLQETWLAVVRNAASFEPRAKFTTWLYTVARSKMIDHWRARDDAVSLAYFAGDAANDADEAVLDIPASDAQRPDHQVMARAEARAFLAGSRSLAAGAAGGVPAASRRRLVARRNRRCHRGGA